MKAWIKAYVDDKIVNATVIKRKTFLDMALFEDILREACLEFDYGMPVVLSSHFKHFKQFNRVTFRAHDFIEPISFDRLVVENCF
jgi:hypothetical protein